MSELDVLLQLVPCPECGAPVGQPCEGPDDTWLHECFESFGMVLMPETVGYVCLGRLLAAL